MGHVGGRRFSVGELHAASKTSSANGSHLNVWDFDISAAEFPRVFGVNRPLTRYLDDQAAQLAVYADAGDESVPLIVHGVYIYWLKFLAPLIPDSLLGEIGQI